MKLHSTIGDRAGMLYTAPLVDVILLLIIFFLFGSNLVLKSGVEVRLPSSTSSLPAAEDAHIVTLIPGDTDEFFFNDERTSFNDLESILDEARARSDQIIILGDESVSYGKVMKITQIALRKGFELAFATQQESP